MNNLQAEYFLEVGQNLSYTKAAENLYVSQPAVSRVIASLEEELDCKLFQKNGRKIELTLAGAMYYEAFLKMKKILSDTAYAVKKLDSVQKGTIKLGGIAGWDLSNFLPVLLEKFNNKYPYVDVELTFSNLKELKNELKNSNLDIVITLSDAIYNVESHIHSLCIQKLTKVKRILLFSAKHPLAAKPGLKLADFSDYTFLAIDDGSNFTPVNMVRYYCEPYGFSPQVKLMPNNDSIISAILNSHGVFIMEDLAREKSNRNFHHIELDSYSDLVLAWLETNSNPMIPYLINDLIEVFNGNSCP